MLKIEVDNEKIVEIKASGSTDVICAEWVYAISVICAKLLHDGKDDVAKLMARLVTCTAKADGIMMLFNEMSLRLLVDAIESGKAEPSLENFETLVDVSGVVE